MMTAYEQLSLRTTTAVLTAALLFVFGCTRSPSPTSSSPSTEPAPQDELPSKEEETIAPEGASPGAGSPAPATPAEAPDTESDSVESEPPPSTRPAPSPQAPRRRERSANKKQSATSLDRPPAEPSFAELRSQLDQLTATPPQSCGQAERQKEAICSLAEQLCNMVERDPNVASVESYCQQARVRCRRAQAQIQEHCAHRQ